jgi:hypothetical protein
LRYHYVVARFGYSVVKVLEGALKSAFTYTWQKNRGVGPKKPGFGRNILFGIGAWVFVSEEFLVISRLRVFHYQRLMGFCFIEL